MKKKTKKLKRAISDNCPRKNTCTFQNCTCIQIQVP